MLAQRAAGLSVPSAFRAPAEPVLKFWKGGSASALMEEIDAISRKRAYKRDFEGIRRS